MTPIRNNINQFKLIQIAFVDDVRVEIKNIFFSFKFTKLHLKFSFHLELFSEFSIFILKLLFSSLFLSSS